MIRRVFHVLLLGVECAVLLCLVGYAIVQVLPVPSWAYSSQPQKFEFALAGGQEEYLNKIASCRIYYSTVQHPKLCEQQAFWDTNRVFVAGESHLLVLPPLVTGFRLDFHPKKGEPKFEESPILESVSYGGVAVENNQMRKFFEARLGFSGYFYDIQFFMNGWWRVLIPVGVVIWLAVVVGAWMYFRRQER